MTGWTSKLAPTVAAMRESAAALIALAEDWITWIAVGVALLALIGWIGSLRRERRGRLAREKAVCEAVQEADAWRKRYESEIIRRITSEGRR